MPRGVSRVDEARLQRRLWTPQALGGGLKCWIDYSYGRAIGVSGSEITTVSDPTVSVGWSRVTGGPDFGVGTINNLPGATFTVSPHERVVSDTYIALTTPIVGSAIFQMDSGSANYARVLCWAASSGNDNGSTAGCPFMIRDNGGSNLTTWFNGTIRASTSYTTGSIALFSVVIDASGNISQFLNGTAGGTGTLGGTPAWTAIRFMTGCETVAGSSGSGNAPLEGRFGEAAVYCGNDAALMRHYLEGYLAHKWRHTATMAGTHRFKSAPPLIGG